MRKLSIALLAAGACAVMALPGEADAAAPAEADALARIDGLMDAWAEHRAQTIRVKNIAGLEVSSAPKTTEQLQERLKSLLTKKRSNREWKGYWEGEQGFAKRLLAAYVEVAPPGGGGPLDAELSAARAEAKRVTDLAAEATGKARAANDAVDAAKQALDKALDELKARQPLLEAELEGKKAAFAAASEPIAALEAQLAAAEADAAKAAAQAALDTARTVRKAAEEGLSEAHTALEQTKKLVTFLEGLGDGPVPEAPPTADPELKSRIDALGEAKRAAAEASVAAKAATEVAEAAAGKAARIEKLVRGFHDRRPALEAWAALAGDKMVNQDKYLVAIDTDIAAVEERIAGMAGSPPGGAAGKSQAICEAERKPSVTPLEKYEECSRTTKEEVRDVEAQLEDVKAAALLNERGVGSLDTLLEAQNTDVALLERELAIATGEAARSQRVSETEEWLAAWDTYAERARAKVDSLAGAVTSTKDTKRTLTVNKAFFASEQESLAKRLASLQSALDERTGFGNFMSALAGSAWYFIRHAYMVPLYLLIAWLLLRASRKVAARVVKSAEEEAESRDEVQRVETLAAVARGAVRLVVYIATGLLCLEAIGVDTGPILGGAAIFGLAISFGSQSLVKDFVTGFFILLENQYAVGDVVEIGGEAGTVQSITLRRTVLRDLAGKVRNIPNGSITNVTNNTQGFSGVLIHIGVAYGTDLDLVEEVVNREGDKMFADPEWASKLTEPPRYIGLTQFGDSALTVRVTFKTQIFEQWAAERAFNRRIKDAFEEAGIGIPFPQRDLHIISAPPALIGPPADAA